MTPYQTWKSNKGRVDLRKYTREFQKKFKHKRPSRSLSFEAGEVYAVSYKIDTSIPTDKHHVTPVILCLGRFVGDDGITYIRSINLLYLSTKECVDLLDDAYKIAIKMKKIKSANSKISLIIELHDKYLRIFPWAYKNLQEVRVKSFDLVDIEEWGMIPLLYKYLMGNFNPTGLNEDFQKEFKSKKKYSPEKKKVKEEVEEVISEDMIDMDIGDPDLEDIYE